MSVIAYFGFRLSLDIIDSTQMKVRYLVVGAGLAGATYARLAAEQGITVTIIDQRTHIAGNCYTYQDEESKVEVHKYGPHIFHTNSEKVWQFVNRFTRFNSYINRVKARSNGRIYSLPINLHTINQYFNKDFTPAQAEAFIDRIRIKDLKPTNFEEFVLSNLGTELYEAFYKYYTIKHWGIEPTDIPVSTAKRLPIRFNYNDNYFNDRYQGIPIEGYTKMVERMLDHANINIIVGQSFEGYRSGWRHNYDHLVFTGSIDNYYDYSHGALPYRTLRFEEIRGRDIIGNAVLNYTDMTESFTRVHEHKWFTPEQKFESSIAFKEYPSDTDSRNNPIYPIRNHHSEMMYKAYSDLSKEEEDVTFVGRLAEFRYYDMHQVIAASMAKFEKESVS